MTSDDHLLPSGIDSGKLTKCLPKVGSPYFNIYGAVTGDWCFSGRFCSIPSCQCQNRATGMAPLRICLSIRRQCSNVHPSRRATGADPPSYLNCWKNGDSTLETPNCKQKPKIDWFVFFSFSHCVSKKFDLQFPVSNILIFV